MITVKDSEGRELEIVPGAWVFFNDNEKGINHFENWDNLSDEEQKKYSQVADQYSLKSISTELF
jgi:hypothetical protein